MVFAQPAANSLDTKVVQSEQRSGPAGVTNDTNHLKLENKKEFCTYLVVSQKLAAQNAFGQIRTGDLSRVRRTD